MATSGQDQGAVWLASLAPRPTHEWTEEDVARFFEEMGLRDSVTETFKRKRNIANLLQSTKLRLQHFHRECGEEREGSFTVAKD